MHGVGDKERSANLMVECKGVTSPAENGLSMCYLTHASKCSPVWTSVSCLCSKSQKEGDNSQWAEKVQEELRLHLIVAEGMATAKVHRSTSGQDQVQVSALSYV